MPVVLIGPWGDGSRSRGSRASRLPGRRGEAFLYRSGLAGMPTVAGEEPVAGFSGQPAPVLAQFFE
jgi:hypothetical protein